MNDIFLIVTKWVAVGFALWTLLIVLIIFQAIVINTYKKWSGK